MQPAILERGIIPEARTNVDIERVEAEMLTINQVECPVTHRFTPGMYMREVFMPKGAFVIGHEHRTEHFNIVLSGSALVMIDGVVARIVAPCVFTSGAGVRKVLFIEEDMRWATTHVTDLTDLKELEAQLIVKSPTFTSHHENLEIERMKRAMETQSILMERDHDSEPKGEF